MNLDFVIKKALGFQFLSCEEGLFLYERLPVATLILIANELRNNLHSSPIVTWIIDRNINITDLCATQCKFCNFHKKPNDPTGYITTIDQYKIKIDELFKSGGRQLLLQGGMHPDLGLGFYTGLFKELKTLYPELRLHALGPPEVVHLARMEKKSCGEILDRLIEAGLDSLPGAGAEILSDRVRKLISPAKCKTSEWLDVMREAHKRKMVTSATMMFGHIETLQERLNHLVLLRSVQEEKPAGSHGFISFTPWPFQDKGTYLKEKMSVENSVTSGEYIKTIAISRIMLPNVMNIQASWLTMGKDVAQICLHAGANDFGSIMIEENVVSSAGASFKLDAAGIRLAIKKAGFVPRLRNQMYELV